jgi:hypothetical protein
MLIFLCLCMQCMFCGAFQFLLLLVTSHIQDIEGWVTDPFILTTCTLFMDILRLFTLNGFFQSCMWTQIACVLKDINLNTSLFEVYFCFCSDRSIMLYDLRVSSPARKLIMRVSLIIYQLKVKCMVMILDLLFTFFDDLHQLFCCLGKVNWKMTSDSPPPPPCKEINSSMFIEVHSYHFLIHQLLGRSEKLW